MTNLFSSFDPSVLIILVEFSGNWLSLLFPLVFIFQPYWCTRSQLMITIITLLKGLKDELRAVLGKGDIQGNIFLFTFIFIYILFTNTMGLVPYVFTGSRHLVYTMALALPLWLGNLLWSIINQFNRVIAHLVPLGTPGVLMPVIVIIESIRRVIRPLTLAVRLAANIVAGHLLLSLIGSQLANLSVLLLIAAIVGLIMLIVLEMAVACIQSYVFTVLNTLYLKELRREYLNKINIK